MDGDEGSYFQTTYGMDDGDDFLVLLGRPIPLQSLHVTTGDTDGQDLLTNGFVETSPDGVRFHKAAHFNKAGVADVVLRSEPVAALRVRLDRGAGIPNLLIREITLKSPVKIAHVERGPGRGFYDVSASPDLAPWAQQAETEMESFWPDTEALLYSDKFIPPNMVNVVYKTGPGVTDVAATGGGVMTVNTAWCHQHPEDTGLTVHETAHVIQAYSTYNPVWLVEGIADYIRWVRFEPGNFQYVIDPKKSTYHDSYRTTAAFLAWCELHYDSALVTKLSRAVRFGTYDTAMFKQYCGKDVDTLWSEFVTAYQADPKGVLTPALAAANRLRVFPAVTPGTSTPVDLTLAFNATGLYTEGGASPAATGVDGEGNGYSSGLLGTSRTWMNVKFNLGPANAPDMVACGGSVVALPSSRYSSLWILATAVEGNQMSQSFTVTYTDSSKDVLAQNFSDWFSPSRFSGEGRAVPMPYRLTADGAKDSRTFYVYGYGFSLDPAKTVRSVTLPNNPFVKVLAVSLAN